MPTMHLSAAFVPPPEVSTELERVVAGVPVVVTTPPPAPAVRRGADGTTAEYLENLVAALQAIDGEWWVQSSLSVQRPNVSGLSGLSTETLEELPLRESLSRS